MSLLGDIVLRLKADTADFQSDMGKAARQVEIAARQMTSSMDMLKGGLVALGAGAALHGLETMVRSTIDAGDQFNKMSQKVGIGVESLSGLAYAAQLSDLSLQGMQIGMKKLSTAMVEANAGSKEQANIFKAIGVAYKETSGSLRAPEEALLDVADKFANMKNSAEKSALAVKLFGKSGLEMVPFLNMGSAAIRRLIDEAKEFGVVWSKEAAQGAEDFNDNMKRIKAMNEGLVVSLVTNMLPSLLKVQEAFISSKTAAGGFYNQLRDLLNDRNKLEEWAGQVGEAFARVADTISTTWNTIALGIETVVAVAAKAAAVMLRLQSYTPTGMAMKVAGVDLKDAADQAQSLAESASSSAAARARGMADGKSYTDAFQAQWAAWRKRSLQEQIYGAGGSSSIPGAKTVPDLSGIKQGLSPEQELKKYISSMQALEKEYFTMQGYGKVALLEYETEKGSLRELTQAHKDQLVAMAKKIDAYRTAQIMRDEAFKGGAAQLEMEQKGKELLDEYANATKLASDQAAFELTLLTKTQREQELLNATRQVDLDLRRQIAALPAVDIDGNVDAGAMEALQKLAEARKAALFKDITDRQIAERDFVTGAKKAFNDYAESAMNAAQNAQTFFTNAFSKMEDALVDFAMTGKLDFKKLADSIISDLIRIQLRASVLGPLAKSAASGGGILSGLKGLFGMSGSSNTTTSANFVESIGLEGFASGTDYVPYDMIAQIHQGERIIPAAENTAANRGGGINIEYLDMKGASVEAVQRLQALFVRLNASIESRAVSAVFDQNLRGNRP